MKSCKIVISALIMSLMATGSFAMQRHCACSGNSCQRAPRPAPQQAPAPQAHVNVQPTPSAHVVVGPRGRVVVRQAPATRSNVPAARTTQAAGVQVVPAFRRQQPTLAVRTNVERGKSVEAAPRVAGIRLATPGSTLYFKALVDMIDNTPDWTPVSATMPIVVPFNTDLTLILATQPDDNLIYSNNQVVKVLRFNQKDSQALKGKTILLNVSTSKRAKDTFEVVIRPDAADHAGTRAAYNNAGLNNISAATNITQAEIDAHLVSSEQQMEGAQADDGLFTEDQEAALIGMSDEQFDKFFPKEKQAPAAAEPDTEDAVEPTAPEQADQDDADAEEAADAQPAANNDEAAEEAQQPASTADNQAEVEEQPAAQEDNQEEAAEEQPAHPAVDPLFSNLSPEELVATSEMTNEELNRFLAAKTRRNNAQQPAANVEAEEDDGELVDANEEAASESSSAEESDDEAEEVAAPAGAAQQPAAGNGAAAPAAQPAANAAQVQAPAANAAQAPRPAANALPQIENNLMQEPK